MRRSSDCKMGVCPRVPNTDTSQRAEIVTSGIHRSQQVLIAPSSRCVRVLDRYAERGREDCTRSAPAAGAAAHPVESTGPSLRGASTAASIQGVVGDLPAVPTDPTGRMPPTPAAVPAEPVAGVLWRTLSDSYGQSRTGAVWMGVWTCRVIHRCCETG